MLLANVDDHLRVLLDLKSPKNLSEASDIVVKYFYSEQRISSLHQDNRFKPKHFVQQQVKPQNQNAFTHTQRETQRINPMQFVNPKNNPYNHTAAFNQNTTPRFNNTFAQNHTSQYTPNANFNNAHNYKQTFPSQPININTQPVQRKYFTNDQVFGKPKNVFDPKNAPKNTSKPEPMSTTSRAPSARYPQRQQNYFASNGKPNFRSEELFNTHVPDVDEQYIDQEEPQYVCPEDDSNDQYTNTPENEDFQDFIVFDSEPPES